MPFAKSEQPTISDSRLCRTAFRSLEQPFDTMMRLMYTVSALDALKLLPNFVTTPVTEIVGV